MHSNVPVCPILGYVTSTGDHGRPQHPLGVLLLALYDSMHYLGYFTRRKVSCNVLKVFKTAQQINNETTHTWRSQRAPLCCLSGFQPAMHPGFLPFPVSSLKPHNFTRKSVAPNIQGCPARVAHWHDPEGHATQAALSCRDPHFSVASKVSFQRWACANICHVCLFSCTGVTQ